jgi:hypothetical protein
VRAEVDGEGEYRGEGYQRGAEDGDEAGHVGVFTEVVGFAV